MNEIKPKIRRLESNNANTGVALVKQFHLSDVSLERIERLLSNEANYLIVAEIEDSISHGFILGASA